MYTCLSLPLKGFGQKAVIYFLISLTFPTQEGTGMSAMTEKLKESHEFLGSNKTMFIVVAYLDHVVNLVPV